MKAKNWLRFGCCLTYLGASCGSPPNVSKQSTSPSVSSAISVSSTNSTNSTAPIESPPREEDPDAVYQMRQMHLSEWIDKAKKDCQRTKNTGAYLPEREGFPPEEIELVKKRCAEAVEVGMRGQAWIRAMSACSDRFVQAKGTGRHECRLMPKDLPDVPPELFDRHKAACAESCANAGFQQMELNKERSQFVRCCDGTTSPSCTYASIRSDCCAGHQGVCIPD